MSIEINLESIDYIALCPGYTDRLLHKENTYKNMYDKTMLSKVRRSDQDYANFYKKFKYNMLRPTIKKVTTPGGPELKFWLWGYWNGEGEPERLYQNKISDCPVYLENDYVSEKEFSDDNHPYVTPLLISSCDIYLLDEDEGTTIIDTFYPKYREDLCGSIIFGPSEKNPTLEMVDWIHLARSINIEFCGCYDPTYPYKMKMVYTGGKSMLIVEFDCESG